MSAGRLSLETIKIASPCNASWDEMPGTERVRFGAECRLQVYNLSGMSVEEAGAFLERARGQERTCVRLFRRADGTILTQDCPVGLRLLRRVSVGLTVTLATCGAFLIGVLGLSTLVLANTGWLPGWTQPGSGGAGGGGGIMGDICPPPGEIQPVEPGPEAQPKGCEKKADE